MSPQDHSVTEDQLVKHIKFLVDNIYIQVGNKIFRQAIGIPMGTDCAPLLANLFLFYHEYKFMKAKLKQNSQVAKLFSNTFRYIDDLIIPRSNRKLATYTHKKKKKKELRKQIAGFLI